MAEETDVILSPRKEDVLFRSGLPDWHNEACLGFTHPGDEIGYTEGYRRAARLLVQHVNEHGRDQDYLVFPVFFLYRHHIELVLKNILRAGPYLLDRSHTNTEAKHLEKHRLDLLWQDVKPLYADVCKAVGWGKPDPEDEAGIDSYIRQITALDRDSFSFRYALAKDGVPSLPSALKGFNLRNFAELIERLADHLDALDSAIDHLREGKIESEVLQQEYEL